MDVVSSSLEHILADTPSLSPPHLRGASLPHPTLPDYILVIPSFNRPAMLRKKTFSIILEQGISLDRVFIFVADGCAPNQSQLECTRYCDQFVPEGLPAQNIVIGVRGILEQRNFIVRWAVKRFGELKHVVSMDDDLDSISYKVATGVDSRGAEVGNLKRLEKGGLEAWISHAADAMLKYNCFIWSLNTSANPYYMRSDIIGTSCGMCNGYLYGFRVRADESLMPCFKRATEDRERSVRYFAKDGIHLRYKMYCAQTKPFDNEGGLQDDYDGKMDDRRHARKVDEREGHALIAKAFPTLYQEQATQKRKRLQTMEGGFCTAPSTHSDLGPGSLGIEIDLRPRMRQKRCSSSETPSNRCSSVAYQSRKARASKYMDDYRAEHGRLKEAPADWLVERGAWASGHPYTKYKSPCGKTTCYSLPQIEAFLGKQREVANESASAGSMPVASTASNHSEGDALDGRTGVVADHGTCAPHREWACSTCTLLNPVESTTCEACGGSPDTFTTVTAKHQGFVAARGAAWTCTTCTYQNTEIALACGMCGTIRPDLHAWECLRCSTRSPTNDDNCVGCGLKRSENQHGSFDMFIDSDSDYEVEEAAPPKRFCAPVVDATKVESETGRPMYWTCLRCTFDNDKACLSCLMCETKRPFVGASTTVVSGR